MNVTRQPGDPVPPEVRAAILAELQQGDLYSDICARYGVTKQYISKMAGRNGLKRNDRPRALSAAQEAELVARYEAGERVRDLVPAFHISGCTVLETVYRLAGTPRGHGIPQGPLRHDAFDVLTPEAAYWCGFIFTDGTVVQRATGQPDVAIVLQRRDRHHLVKFRDFLGCEHAITPMAPSAVRIDSDGKAGMGTGAFRFAVRSQQLASRLLALGRYGPAVDPELAASRDFWRGCVDGDGTVGVSCSIPQLKLVGSHWLLSAFVDFLGPVSSRRPLNVRPARRIFVVSTSYKTAVKVTRRLYTGASVALDRKAAMAAHILSEY